ncbi:MAG: ureidoglycolate lyase [Gammaproteobacteria bacterium]|nr:ureidoglycolate lyase [Gammaproteobacteria bacterium]
MKTINLTPIPLTSEDFSLFGEVVDSRGGRFMTINDGYARKYANLATIDTQEADGTTAVHIFVARKRQFPLRINMLEKHPFFSQAFIPRSTQPFVVVVAPPSETPNIEKIQAFITDGEQGVNYARGVWHFPLISLGNDNQFITIDRKHNGHSDTLEQCVIFPINKVEINLRAST